LASWFIKTQNVRNSNAKNDCELFVVLNDLDVIVHGFIMFMYHVHAVDQFQRLLLKLGKP